VAPLSVPAYPKGPARIAVTELEQNAAAPVQAQSPKSLDFYVVFDGKDANDGSRMHPWATITHAAKVAGPGATVHVLPGTYDESIVTTVSGTAEARIKYVSERKWRAVISPATHGSFVWQNTGDFTDIVEFDVAGTDCNGIALGGSHQRAVGNNVHNRADGCADRNGGSGIADYSYTSRDNDIVGNYVHDVGIGDPLCAQAGHRGVHGIYQSNAGGHIENNVVVHNCVFGIHLWHAATHATIVNNTVAYNLGGGILVGTGDAPCNTSGCPGGDDFTIVKNNIVAFNGNPQSKGWGITESSGAVGIHNQYSRNLSYQNVSGDFALSHHLMCRNCIENKDPGFVSPSAGDFHLARTSPAVGDGTKDDAPQMDFENATRARKGTVDIGAYEMRVDDR
jgi:hypothetical protein